MAHKSHDANMKTDVETKDDQHSESSFVVKPFQGEKKERTMEAIYIWLGCWEFHFELHPKFNNTEVACHL